MEKEEFSFLNTTISSNNIYKLFYKKYMENSKIIVDYIKVNFKDCNKENSLDKLNRLAQILKFSGIEYSNNIYEYINSNTYLLTQCIEYIIDNNEIEKLNELAIPFIESYYLYNENIKYDTQIDEYLVEDVENDNSNNYYISKTIQEIRKIPLLNEEETKLIINKYQQTKKNEYRDKIIIHNLRLIIPIASKYSRKWRIDVEDLILEGTFGIIRALEDYDQNKAKFSTYASYWINQKINRFIVDTNSNIRIPVNQYEKLIKYKKAYNKLTAKFNRIPTDQELANELNVSINRIIEFKQFLQPIKSLNDTITIDSEDELVDLIPSKDLTPEEKSISQNFDDLKIAMSKLNEDQKNVISLRYGLYDGISRTLQQVCRDLYDFGLKKNKLTGERARQIEVKALEILRDSLENKENKNNNSNRIISEYSEEDLDKNIKSLINILKNTDKETKKLIFKDIPNYYTSILYKYFDNKFNKKEAEIPNDIKIVLATQLLEKVSSKRDKIINEMNENNTSNYFPINIYSFFDIKDDIEKTKEDLNRCIDRLPAEKRYLLAKYYDIYNETGNIIKNEILESDRKNLNQVLKDLDFDMPTSKHKVYKQKKKI